MTIVEMSAGGAVLIAVILLLRRCLLNRLPKWTFLLLWAVALCRLLVPFTLPSQLSVYTGAARIAQAVQEEEAPSEEPADVQIPILISPAAVPGTFREDSPVLPAVPVSPEPEREPVSPLTAVWLTGTALCGVFFGAAYLWTLRRFWDAVPAEADFLTRWREEHPTLRPVQVKTCGAVNAPVAYGLIRPVILLPQNTDWTDEGQLTYILTHEYVHIRRGDLLWKLLLTAALCVHWFNPLVWVMYFRANRDLELACDEAVVRILGLDSRKGYAYALLSAAESGFSPLCLTYTTKNHMEERIHAIMKMKKKSVAAILTAALLVAGVTAVFATSKAPEPKDISDLPSAVMTNTDPKPAPGDKSVPDDRVHPVAPADTSTPDVSRVHPVTGQPAGTSEDAPQKPDPAEPDTTPTETTSKSDILATYPVNGTDLETVRELVKRNHWGVPYGEIPLNTEFRASDDDDFNALLRYLKEVHGLENSNFRSERHKDGTTSLWVVSLEPYQNIKTNSKGQTYGDSGIVFPDADTPDLIEVPHIVDGKNVQGGVRCYVLKEDIMPYRYPGEVNNPDDAMDYMAWMAKLPYNVTLPAYDQEGNSLGTTEVLLNYDAKGGRLTPAQTAGMDLETVREEVKNNRWGVPYGEIPEGTEIRVDTEEELEELRQYLTEMRGIREGDMGEGVIRNGGYVILITYEQTEQEKRLANGYPVNSRGETYGNSGDSSVMGYEPELIAVMTTSGKSGYAFDRELQFGDYPSVPKTMEEWRAFHEWQDTQPSHRLVKVYDVNRDNVIGYFPVGDGKVIIPQSEELEMISTQLRNWGLSEEKIAEELGYYKYRRGMW